MTTCTIRAAYARLAATSKWEPPAAAETTEKPAAQETPA